DNERLAATLREAQQGLIVVGPRHCDERLAEPILRLGERLGFPVLADPLSGLRGRAAERTSCDLVIAGYDALLRAERFAERAAPELVLRFGPMLTSKAFLLYLQRHPHCQQIVIDHQGGWEEPTQLASEVVQADPWNLSWGLLQTIPRELPERADTRWRDLWRR